MSAWAPAAGARRWACSADDFAIDDGASDAITELLARGRLTSTSALVDAPAWRSAARALPAGAEVGLHLNLTESLAARGQAVWPLAELIVRCRSGLLPRARVREAIARQIEAFEDALGRRPDFVDGHQHVHQFAIVRDELLAALAKRYGRDGPWLRSTRRPAGVRDVKARLIAALGDAALRRAAAAAGFRVSAWLVGVYGFDPRPGAWRARLQRWLHAGPDGSVLMCHPARGPRAQAARAHEYALLASDEFPALLEAAGVLLTRGSDLTAPVSKLPSPAAAGGGGGVS